MHSNKTKAAVVICIVSIAIATVLYFVVYFNKKNTRPKATVEIGPLILDEFNCD